MEPSSAGKASLSTIAWPTRRLVARIAVLAMLMSCAQTSHVRVPISDAAAKEAAARACVAACPPTTGSYACYLACPGALELEGPCTKDRPRDNACVEKTPEPGRPVA